MVSMEERRRIARALRGGYDVVSDAGGRFWLNGTLFGLDISARSEERIRCGLRHLAGLIDSCANDVGEIEVLVRDQCCAAEIERYATEKDPEEAHCDADELLLGLLENHGYSKVVNAFRSLERWYA